MYKNIYKYTQTYKYRDVPLAAASAVVVNKIKSDVNSDQLTGKLVRQNIDDLSAHSGVLFDQIFGQNFDQISGQIFGRMYMGLEIL